MPEQAAPANAEARPVDWRTIALGVVALLGTAMLIALVILQGNATRERDAALKLQSRSYEVMILARGMSTAMAEAEASLGRYVISAEADMARTYYDRWVKAGGYLDRLAQMTRDDGGQASRAKALRHAYAERGKELNRIALYTAAGRNQPAFAFYNAARRTPSLARLGKLSDAVISSERETLRRRSALANLTLERANRVTRTVTGLVVPVAFGAMLLGWLALRTLRERREAIAEATAERERSDELEATVAATTAELKQETHDRTQAEAQLRQAQKMDAVGQLTGGIAHDFNNMLAVVLGGLELAKRHLHSGGADAERHIENAMEGANRAAALTRRLLAFSRAEPLLPAAVETGQLIAGMSDLLNRTLGEAVRIVACDDGLGWQIWTDPHQLENAILNLAVNARDAIDGRGVIRIDSGGQTLSTGEIGECAGGDYVTIAVSDNGCGMTPEVMERVFEPFFTTKPVGKGTGLGLSQIFGFVRQAEGEIVIDSTPGRGTTVTLYLPRHIAQASDAAHAPDSDAAPQPAAPATLDILVVEDDPRVLSATMAALRELGHRPLACPDPLQAPAMLDGMARIDLILSDVLMPGQTGPEMIAALKPRLGGVAILFVTGYAGESDTEMFGGHGVLRKPFTIAALERAIGDAIRPSARPAAASG